MRIRTIPLNFSTREILNHYDLNVSAEMALFNVLY